MSIVQDAVKKAQVASGYKVNDDKRPIRKRGMNGYLLFFIIGIALLLLITFIMMRNTKVPAEISLKDVSVAEAIYKPISAVTSRQTTESVKKTNPPPDLILSGIMQLVDGPRAIINDVVVGTGDIISGARVVKIDKNKVTLQDRDRELVLGME